MGTYLRGLCALAQRHRLLYLLAALLLSTSPVSAQERRYLLELSAGGLNQSYDLLTGLKKRLWRRRAGWAVASLSVIGRTRGRLRGGEDKVSNIGINTWPIAASHGPQLHGGSKPSPGGATDGSLEQRRE